MKKKTLITLPNGKEVTLVLTYDDYNFFISALDENRIKVGQCKFNIEKIFREQYTPGKFQHVVRLNVTRLDHFNATGNTYIRDTGEVFDYDKTITTLDSINILSEDYFKVGLGTAMCKEMEKVSRTYNSSSIEGFYNPNGKFAHGAERFYKNNGFTFDKTTYPSLTVVRKILQKLPHKTPTSVSDKDTPNM